jgi:parallel beta-helix repeat protein
VDISQGRLILENCLLFSNAAAAPVVMVRGGADPQITHNKIVHEGGGAGVLMGEARGLVENNEISAKDNFGVAIIAGAGGTIVRQNRIRARHIGVSVTDKSTATVDGNDISESNSGIDVSASEITVTRNHIFGCGTGIRLDQGSRGRVEDNEIAKNKRNGIEVESGVEVAIVNNVLEGNGAYGIALPSGSSASLSKNTFRGNVAGEIKEPQTPKS